MSEAAPARHAYLHVPFCARRCSYCDFAIAVRRVVPVDDYLDGIARELAWHRARDLALAPLDTVYLGGGTPSRLGGDGVARLFDLLRRHVTIAEDAEVTLEANPEDVTPAAVASWRASGVNRVSLGVQSFDPAVLAWMHRVHSAAQAVTAAEQLRDGGLSALSVDLIFAVPDALVRDWRRDLDAVLTLAPDHVSVYGLTVESATPLGRWTARGDVTPADDDRYAREFLDADAHFTAAGFDHYEVSNYARRDETGAPSHRARHNSAYWSRVPYLALGPGAHGFDGTSRWWNHSAYAHWLAALRKGETPVEGRERPDVDAQYAEAVYLGLRTTDGLPLDLAEPGLVAGWVTAGWAQVAPDARVRLTPEGWLRLDALAAALTSRPSRCEL
ncbi:MAG: radical SAM family heme chaperone HemW [Gemmatimonadaceae bacterium]|jgi:oxygen-independent coproporphyrinogen-3 oxidase|nr:radical SAM family heme chaperone HemW [Gemmatimonadaceae bacterium]